MSNFVVTYVFTAHYVWICVVILWWFYFQLVQRYHVWTVPILVFIIALHKSYLKLLRIHYLLKSMMPIKTASAYIPDWWWASRAGSRFAPSQWETVLLCNDVSYWLGANLKSALGFFMWNIRLHAHSSLQWRYNGHDSISNHQPHGCLLNCSFRRRSKKTWKLRVTGLCAGNSPATGEFPAQMASNAENVPILWRHHGVIYIWI